MYSAVIRHTLHSLHFKNDKCSAYERLLLYLLSLSAYIFQFSRIIYLYSSFVIVSLYPGFYVLSKES